jgi:hypothetical protein
MSGRERDPEPTDCRNCEATFNLSAQYYYDNLCPSCKAEQDGEDVTRPACTNCGDRIPEGEVKTATTYVRGVGRESVKVCSDECKRKIEERIK